jgi:hypothetical protein
MSKGMSLWAIVSVGVIGSLTRADVMVYEDFVAWQAVTPNFVTIDFTDLPNFTFVTDQYADQGVIFTDGDDIVFGPSPTFPLDGFGIDGQGEFNFHFSSPQSAIATHFTGGGQLLLFHQGQLVFNSGPYSGTEGTFLGFSSTQLFDAARIIDDDPSVVFDNLYFGVPGPGVLPLLAMAGAIGERRRRSPGASPVA